MVLCHNSSEFLKFRAIFACQMTLFGMQKNARNFKIQKNCGRGPFLGIMSALLVYDFRPTMCILQRRALPILFCFLNIMIHSGPKESECYLIFDPKIKILEKFQLMCVPGTYRDIFYIHHFLDL